MPYKFLPASLPIQYTPKETYRNDFAQNLKEQFYNASDWYTIEEETFLASKNFQSVDVRINDVIDAKTGDRVGDDFKLLLFSELDHPTDLGRIYKFGDNYWITVNIDKINTLVATVTVRRCNNVLRWQDVSGAIYEVPCIINYLIKENRDYSTAGSAIVVPSGMIEIIAQFNSDSNRIKANQRFLFGNPNNWTAYRVEGGGISNFNNLKTFDNTSAGIIRFSMATDYVNSQTDDVVNGIADYIQDEYTLILNQTMISGNISQQVQLRKTITLNGIDVVRDTVWRSSDILVATVDSNGLVTFVSQGNAIITCQLLGNENVYDTCSVSVGSTPVDNYQIVFSPNKNYVYENEEIEFSVHLYKNNIQQSDVISFSLNTNNVPSDNYIYQVTGSNTFTIHNYKMFLNGTLDITATSGIYSKILSISLRGLW